MEYGLADMNKNLSQVLQDIAQKQMENGTFQRMTIIIGITTEKVERPIRGFEQYTENHTTLMNMMEVCIEI